MSDQSPLLILVPTLTEQKLLAELFEGRLSLPRSVRLCRCGFGVIAAAARTAQLITQHRPARVLLVGIAGSYTSDVETGAAMVFDRVVSYGIGAGTGADHQSARALGWNQWEDASQVIGDELPLKTAGERSSGLLLTCCSASASISDVQHRQQQQPRAVAEDMEGFAVATACRLAAPLDEAGDDASGIPLTIVRGISNTAGDRDKSNWDIAGAMASAADRALEIINRVLAD